MTERTPTAEALEKAREIRHNLTRRGGLMQFLRIWPDPAPAFDALLALALEDFAAQAVKPTCHHNMRTLTNADLDDLDIRRCSRCGLTEARRG